MMIRSILIGVFLLFVTGQLRGQDIFLQEESQSVEEMSRVLTEKYQPELVMTGSQTRLFERKLGEFLIRMEKIKQMNLSDEDKLHMLERLSEQETEEMANILTRPQIKRYVKVKPKFQPIAMVVDSVKN